MWPIHIRRFGCFLKLERGLSASTIEANTGDIEKLTRYFELFDIKKAPGEVVLKDLQGFSRFVGELNYSTGSHARIISGVKSFFKYCVYDAVIKTDPSELWEAPKIVYALPMVLSIQEIEALFSLVDLTTNAGFRNRVMLETLYSCGLRISELLNLQISCLYLDQQFIRVTGKGDKERLVPIGATAAGYIAEFLKRRNTPSAGNEDILFTSANGNKLTKTSISLMLKDLVTRAGITKKVSPHTFRHSFATHMLERGADLISIRDMLGHESVTTTEIYLHMDVGHLRKTLTESHPAWQ